MGRKPSKSQTKYLKSQSKYLQKQAEKKYVRGGPQIKNLTFYQSRYPNYEKPVLIRTSPSYNFSKFIPNIKQFLDLCDYNGALLIEIVARELDLTSANVALTCQRVYRVVQGNIREARKKIKKIKDPWWRWGPQGDTGAMGHNCHMRASKCCCFYGTLDRYIKSVTKILKGLNYSIYIKYHHQSLFVPEWRLVNQIPTSPHAVGSRCQIELVYCLATLATATIAFPQSDGFYVENDDYPHLQWNMI